MTKQELLIPKVEEVRELEENQQKEKISDYIRCNLGEYAVDIHGNFYNNNAEKKNSDYYYISKEKVFKYERIIKIMSIMIIKEKEEWEIKDGNYHNIKDNRVMFSAGFTSKQNEKIKWELSISNAVSDIAEILEMRGVSKEERRENKGKWVNMLPVSNSSTTDSFSDFQKRGRESREGQIAFPNKD